MSDLFGRHDLIATARRNPAAGPPASFVESVRSAFNVTAETGMSISAESSLNSQYETYLDHIRKTTGKRFANPRTPPFDAFLGSNPDRPTDTREMRMERERALHRDVTALRKDFPDLVPVSPEDIRERIAESRFLAREERAEVARREDGFSAGAFIGTAGAVLLDPPVLASMFFGAPWATGLLRAAVIEAGAAAAGEVVAQAGIQIDRQQFGEKADLGEAALAVGVAAVGGAVFAPLVRGGVIGVKALLKRVEALPRKKFMTRAAEKFLRRKVELEDSNPFDDTPAGRALHAERLSEAQTAVRAGRTVTRLEPAGLRSNGAPSHHLVDEPDLLPTGKEVASQTADATPSGARTNSAATSATTPLARRTLDEEFSPDAGAQALDDFTEARVRQLALDEPDLRISVEEGDAVRSLSAKELVDEIDSEAKFAEAVKGCLT